MNLIDQVGLFHKPSSLTSASLVMMEFLVSCTFFSFFLECLCHVTHTGFVSQGVIQ